MDNPIFISGHLHLSLAMDIPQNPLDPTSYDAETGEGSLGVELLPTSVSHGNLDEQGLGSLAELAVQISLGLNPHHRYAEFTKHGYGVLVIHSDCTIAQFWYTDIS